MGAQDVSTTQAKRTLSAVYGIEGEVRRLPGEKDANFAVATQSGARYLLKLHQPGTPHQDLDLENEAMRHLSASPVASHVPAPLPALDGSFVADTSTAGEDRLVRLLTWLPGRPYADAGPGTSSRLASLGALVGRVDHELAGFTHPAMTRELSWDLVEAAHALTALPLVDVAKRATVERVLKRHATEIVPRLRAMEQQLIHNDANEYNVLIDDDANVCGLIDFGDLVLNPRVCGLAVASAYAIQGQSDPVGAVVQVVAGYHSVAPLTPDELELLYDLVGTRLALSICMAASQHAADPDNAYLLVSQQGVWNALDTLTRQNRDLAHFRFRDACGYEPSPTARDVRRFLLSSHGRAHPVLSVDIDDPAAEVQDWSLGATDFDPIDPDDLATTRQTLMNRLTNGLPFAIGRYGENRDVYRGEMFIDENGRRRTVHLGVDLFALPGTAVYAALDGIVVHVAVNDAPLDYGPVVVIEHRTDTGTPFWTLYGHLDPRSTCRLRCGDSVERGGVIASIGDTLENGGWPPHLHFSVLTALLDQGADIPGVASIEDFDLWSSISLDPNLVLGRTQGVSARVVQDAAYLRRRRRTNFSSAMGVSYDSPLHIVRGQGAYLYDASGRRWLDLVNNVAHVGHCHPRVVEAAHRQNLLLNTNTRYLHQSLVDYGRALAATLPDPLSVCFLVNSGSEANDLALRLAQAHTGQRNWLVLDHAYHGHLSSMIDISPYKFNGPGGTGQPANVRTCAQPNPYRGKHIDGQVADVAQAYAGDVGDQLESLRSAGRGIGAFIVEPIQSVGGQVVPPPGYLSMSFDLVRAAGGLCIVDEVQTGLGRVGSDMWAFEEQGVVPDIVTIGKPVGNGHPLAAVVTTPAIARSFANGMEFFNTFGGNPVSSEVGHAVLSVLRDERLQENAANLGDVLLTGLRQLASRHQGIGDVRGRGLFLGIEFVRDGDDRRPHAARAVAVKEAVKRGGVLISTDGPDNNVLKLKPPMVLSRADCDFFLNVLDEALGETAFS